MSDAAVLIEEWLTDQGLAPVRPGLRCVYWVVTI